MLVSVVIPVYNAERFIEESIGSVLGQSHSEIQLIVVDDGSSDETVQVVRAFDDPRLTLMEQSHGGVCRARNHGMEAAAGDLIAFLDADDLWYPEKLSVQTEELERDPRLLALGSLMDYISADGKRLGVNGEAVADEDMERIAQGRFMPFQLSSTLFRSAVVKDVGGFDEELPGLAEDLDLLARVAAVGPVRGVPRVLGAYRVHPGSASVRERGRHRMATRFVRERLAARQRGGDLSWERFRESYHPSWRQRYGDQVQALYRKSGENAADGQWLAAVGFGLAALFMGPRFTLRRLSRQQRSR
jgi:glycosyltransferase involved in cell wall biosynthesis